MDSKHRHIRSRNNGSYSRVSILPLCRLIFCNFVGLDRIIYYIQRSKSLSCEEESRFSKLGSWIHGLVHCISILD